MAFSYLQSTADTANLSTYTFSSQNIGTAAADRQVIVTISARKGGASTTITGVTIGGIGATQVVQQTNNVTNTNVVGIFMANVPTGTSADVVVTFGSAVYRCRIGVYRADGIVPTPFDTGGSTSSAPTTSLDIPAGGFGIGIAGTGKNTTATWTGLSEDFDSVEESYYCTTGASASFVSEQTGLTVTATFGANNESAGAFASWGVPSITPIIDAVSASDSGFENEDTPADTNPFNSGDQISYTVQPGDSLPEGEYWWRVRGKDPAGTNTWGEWSSVRSFEVTSSFAGEKTQQGRGRLSKSINKQQLGRGRISRVLSITQNSYSRISKTLTNEQSGRAFLGYSFSNDQDAVARIVNEVSLTQDAVTRIQKTLLQEQDSTSRIQKIFDSIQDAVARVVGDIERTQMGRASIKNEATKEQLGRGRIQWVLDKTQISTTRIEKTLDITQSSRGRLVNTLIKNQTAVASILWILTKTQNSLARISNTLEKEQLGRGRIGKLLTNTIAGRAWLGFWASLDQDSIATIQKILIHEQKSMSYIGTAYIPPVISQDNTYNPSGTDSGNYGEVLIKVDNIYGIGTTPTGEFSEVVVNNNNIYEVVEQDGI